tara:strand:+ start:9430 stop:9735 length:306 start_codon:yes stop_codon:yes gene_type:complete
MIKLLKSLFGGGNAEIKRLREEEGAIVIDVRTPAEFNSGHVKGAVNVPLPSIENKVKKLKAYNKPLIFCCASGNRSGRAVSILKQKGLTNIYNGGSWRSLK